VLENALCIQDKLLRTVFRENKELNLELESASSGIASLQSMHDDMSVKPCDNCTMMMVNYTDLWLVHSPVASLLDGARLELRELKAHSTLLGACTTCPLVRSNLEALAVEVKDLKHKLGHSSRYSVLSPPCVVAGSLKGKLFHAIKENTELKQEVAYLTTCLKKIILSEKMIDDDLSRVEESATKSTYKLGTGFERCEDKGEKSVHKFVPSSTYHKEEATIKPTKAHYPSNPKPSFLCFRCKRIKRRRFDYAKNSYHYEFYDFPPRSFSRALPRTSSCALSRFSHGPNHCSYGFSS
jgi:hypothetical protein